jgi:hypothetical protein
MVLSRRGRLSAGLFAIAYLLPGQPVPQQPAPKSPDTAAESPYIEDGGVSVQPWYWLTSASPEVHPGKLSAVKEPASLDFPGKARNGMGVTFSVPAGKKNSLRFSYFRVQGSGDAITPTNLALFSIGYTAGDRLYTKYKLQNVKVSWDFLSYTFHNNIRFKTLWEAQATGFDTKVDSPLKATDSETVSYYGEGKKWLFYPTFGLGLEQAVGKNFRWEVKGSGFGLPKRAALADAEASAVIKVGKAELLAGYKMFYVKTSPKTEFYFKQMLSGPYVGLRWYFERMK